MPPSTQRPRLLTLGRDFPATLRGGFSLTELLVVIALLATLAAFMWPVTQQVQRNSAKVQTISKMRRLVAAGLNYAQDHRGYLPNTFWGVSLGDTNSPLRPDLDEPMRWMTEIHRYVYPEEPRSPGGFELYDGAFRARYLRGHHAVKDAAGFNDWDQIDFVNVHLWQSAPGQPWIPMCLYQMERPAIVPFLLIGANSGSTGITGKSLFFLHCYHPEMPSAPYAQRFPEGTAWVYNNSIIVGYADGHVSVVPWEGNADRAFERIFENGGNAL